MTPSDLELLSRLAAGELPADEAASLRSRITSEPELGRAWERMVRLTEESVRLDAAPPPSESVARWASAAVEARAAERAPSRRGWYAALGAAAVALLALLAQRDQPASGGYPVTATGPVALLDAAGLPLGGAITEVAPRGVLLTGEEARATIALGGTRLEVQERSAVRVEREDRARLQSGEVVASGSVLLDADGAEVRVDGRVAVSLEPARGAVRVMGQQEGSPMDAKSFVAGAAGAALISVFVFDGKAEVRDGSNPPVQLEAQQEWKRERVAQAPRLPGAAVASAREPLSAGATAAAVKPDPREGEFVTWTRPALIAEVKELRARVGALESRLDPDAPAAVRQNQRTWQQDVATLRRLADEGTIELRLPQYMPHQELERTVKVGEKVSGELSLTAEEVAAVEKIYADSAQRLDQGLRALLAEAGEAPDVIASMAYGDLYEQLNRRGAEGDAGRAVRQIANERAGLVPVRGPHESTVVERGVRLMASEDQRTLDEIDALLGPSRSRALHQHKNFPRSIFSSRYGPEDRK